jgi:hypothetical protein
MKVRWSGEQTGATQDVCSILPYLSIHPAPTGTRAHVTPPWEHAAKRRHGCHFPKSVMAFKLRSIWSPTIFFMLLAAHLLTPTTSTTSTSDSATCGFVGDDNTYGLGIRIGLYLQWMTSAIAYSFIPEEAAEMRCVNLLFTLSNFAGTCPTRLSESDKLVLIFSLPRSSLYHGRKWPSIIW